MPFDVASVPTARRQIGSELRSRGAATGRVDDAALVVSELVGNAVRHARPLPGGYLKVTWSLSDDHIEIAVTDGGGPTRPRVLNPPVVALGGRGLAIVEDLTATWGFRDSGAIGAGDSEVTTVYAVVPL